MNITVHGLPAPQGSKRHVGNGIMIESSKNVRPWRQSVKFAVLEQFAPLTDGAQIKGPVLVEMTFTLPKPKGSPKTRKSWPDKRPDLDKLCRSTMDALTDAGVWEDDARVVVCIARKVFPGEGRDSLPVPGAFIRIEAA